MRAMLSHVALDKLEAVLAHVALGKLRAVLAHVALGKVGAVPAHMLGEHTFERFRRGEPFESAPWIGPF